MNGGPNQHYIPKFLLRAFGIPKRRVEIWCFGLDERPVRRRIKRTGSDDYFYSRPSRDGHPTLDDTISAIESQLSQTLREVRSKTSEEPIDPIEAAAIVSHMLSRTAHVRSTLRDGLARLLERFEALFAEPTKVKKMVGLDSDAPTGRFREMVASELARSSGIAGLAIPPRILERVAFVVLKEASTDLLGHSRELVSMALDKVRSQLGELVRDAHNKGLYQAANSNERETLLRTFEWTVESTAESGAILPDCVVIAFGEGGKASSPLFVGGEKLRAVVMPVSPEKLLVGRMPGFELPADFEYNKDAARLSHSFFLSPRNDAETSCLHVMIGEQFTPELEASIEAAFEGILLEGDSGGPGQSGTEPVPYEWRPTAWDSYQVSVTASGDKATSERIQKQLMALVANVANRLPLRRLDGITVGSDYPALLRGVGRGFEGAAAANTVPAEIGVGIAQTITVKRSGVIKGRVVMSGAVCAALISADPKVADWAADIVVKQLARVALIEIVDETLPGRLLAPLESEIDGWLYANVDGVPEAYVASRIAAGFGNGRESRDELRASLVVSLDRLRSVAAEERLAYDTHRDIEKLLNVMLPAVRHVLAFAADLLGHCSSSGESPLDTSGTLAEALDRLGLALWFKEYERHLERFHRRLGRWGSFDEFLAFNLHVERLLWSVGMFAWEDANGLRVTIMADWDTRAFDARRIVPF